MKSITALSTGLPGETVIVEEKGRDKEMIGDNYQQRANVREKHMIEKQRDK